MVDLAARNDGFPLHATIGTLDRVIGIIETGVTGAGVRFGERQLVVNVGVPMAKAATADRAGPSCFLFTKPTLHDAVLPLFYSLM
jgi:hypothetical protein